MAVVLAPVEWTLRRGGSGIVALELAGTAQRGEEILALWGHAGRSEARRSLLLDFPYMLTYGVLMIALTEWISVGLHDAELRKLSAVGPVVGWAQVLAVTADAVEGGALLTFLKGRHTEGCARLARGAALTKFGCLGVGLCYLAVGLTTRGVKQLAPGGVR